MHVDNLWAQFPLHLGSTSHILHETLVLGNQHSQQELLTAQQLLAAVLLIQTIICIKTTK